MVKVQNMMKMMNRLYYDPAKPSAFSTLHKLQAAASSSSKVKGNKTKNQKEVRRWLLQQDAYTLHKPSRKKFQRNPYTVTNIGDVWEVDLADVRALSKYNDRFKYLLTVIDVFSKYAHSIPLRSKTGPSVASAFATVLAKTKYKPVWVRTDKGKEFLNATFQGLLKKNGIQFQVCRNPDVKCAVIERYNRTLKTRMYKYFTYRNTYRFIDVLDKFVKGYNDTVHSAIGMAPSRVRESDVLAIWNRMMKQQLRGARQAPVVYHIGDNVRISREKIKFEKGFQQTFSTEIFKVSKIVRRFPQPVYELEDLRGIPIEGQFYREELTPVIITKNTPYKIDKILGTRVRKGIREHFVLWRGYGSDFDSWMPASSIQKL